MEKGKYNILILNFIILYKKWMIYTQLYLFLIFIINGLLIGLLFDFFRILRKAIKTSDLITYIEDILFWILTGFIILYSTFVFSNGEIRLFMFLAITIGIIAYFLLVSKFILNISLYIINFVKKVLNILLHVLKIPCNFIIKIFKKLILNPISFIIINIRKYFTKKFKIFLKKTKISNKIVKKIKN